MSEITQQEVRDIVGAMITGNVETNIAVTYDDDAGKLDFVAVGGGGDVVGPAGATDHAVSRFDTETGKLLQDSVVIVDDAGAMSGVTTLTVSTGIDVGDTNYIGLGAAKGRLVFTDLATDTITVTDADLIIANGYSINLQEDITFTGATTENQIVVPDNLADALSVKWADGTLMTFDTRDGQERINILKRLDIQTDKVIIVDTYTTAGINAAIDALGADGGTVVLPEGSYNCAGAVSVTIDQANTTLMGMGHGTIFDGSSCTVHVIDVNEKSNCTIKDFRIIGASGSGNAANCIDPGAAGADYLAISGMHVTDSDQHGISTNNSNYCNITGNYVATSDSHGYSAQTTAYSLISGNRSFNNGQYGYYLLAYRNSVTNNVSHTDQIGIGLGGAGTGENAVTGNFIYNYDTRGIYMTGSDNSALTGNVIDIGNATTATHGIYVDGSDNSTITGNIVRNGTANGGQDIYISNSDYCVIASNSIETTAGRADAGIYLADSDWCSITGNVSTDHDVAGIILDATSDNNHVAWNNLEGETTAKITDAGANNTIANSVANTITYNTTNITGVGTFSSGAITSSSTISGTTITASVAFELGTGDYVGLGAAKGRLVFTDAGTDTIAFSTCDVAFGGGNVTGMGTLACGAITSTGTSQMSVLGVGLARVYGTCHVQTADAGAVVPHANWDDLVVENNTHGGITIMTPDGSVGGLFFTSPANTGAYGGYISFLQSSGRYRMSTGQADGYIELITGSDVLALTLDASQNATFSGNIDMATTKYIGLGAAKGRMIWTDAATDQVDFTDAIVTMGDGGSTNYMSVSTAGDVLFYGTAGLAFAEIYAYDAASTVVLAGAGIANKGQVIAFDTNGPSNGVTPDHTNDHITIVTPGMYLCVVSMTIESVGGGGADEVGCSVWKNNGATEFQSLHFHRKLAGGGGDTGSASMSGIIDLAASDTIEIWLWNEASGDDIVVDDVNLSLIQIGGT